MAAILDVSPGSKNLTIMLSNQQFKTVFAGSRTERVARIVIGPWQSVWYIDNGNEYHKTAGREAIHISLKSRVVIARRTV